MIGQERGGAKRSEGECAGMVDHWTNGAQRRRHGYPDGFGCIMYFWCFREVRNIGIILYHCKIGIMKLGVSDT